MTGDYEEAVRPEPVLPRDDPAAEAVHPGAGVRSIGNEGSTPDPSDEFDQARSIGNPGRTPDPADEYDQPRSIGNPGSTPDPSDEYGQPRASGNLGPRE